MLLKIFHCQVLTSREATEARPLTPRGPPLAPSPAPTPSPRAPGLRGPDLPAPPDHGRPALRNPRPA